MEIIKEDYTRKYVKIIYFKYENKFFKRCYYPLNTEDFTVPYWSQTEVDENNSFVNNIVINYDLEIFLENKYQFLLKKQNRKQKLEKILK